MIKVGDKVRFLNDVGGGVVTGFQNSQTALVTDDEHGFEIPTLVTQCVVVDNSNYEIGEGIVETVEEKKSDDVVLEYSENNELKIHLALIPENKETPLAGLINLYLVNDSNYFIYYVCDGISESMKSIEDGLLRPNTKVLVDSITTQVLDEIGKMSFRMIPFKRGKSYDKKSLIETTISIKSVKLIKTSSYKENNFFNDNAIVYNLHENLMEEAVKKISIGDILASNKEKQPSKQKGFNSPKPKQEVIEVDLHIEKLLDNHSGMSNGEIVEYQISKVNTTLSVKHKKGQRIVFIHGVGNGRLKMEILKVLDRKYKYNYQDASFREYGYGATMVII
jgi:hypothetical protein